jgi:GDPmannose 4,6-dehydratase
MGNLTSVRDWGHAKDYVLAMYLMLQQDTADDYVVCTGKTHSVLDFLKESFELVDLDYTKYVEIDSKCYRPAEVNYFKGDNSKAKNKLNWSPSISLEDLVKDMVYNDIKAYTYV